MFVNLRRKTEDIVKFWTLILKNSEFSWQRKLDFTFEALWVKTVDLMDILYNVPLDG